MRQAESISVSGLGVGYGSRRVLAGLSLSIERARLTALVGPNGSGKSTLLRALAGLLRPAEGEVLLEGQPLSAFSRRALAQRVSFLPQSPNVPDGFTVLDLVRQGRHPHRDLFSRWTVADDAACERAMAQTALDELRDRPLQTLSGGQRQRAWIAMSLAQQTGIMLLDEPTNFLDIRYQVEILELLRHLSRAGGKTIVVVLHDLNQAVRYADLIAMLSDGGILASGPARTIVSAETVEAVFGVRTRLLLDPVDGLKFVVPAR